MQKRASQPSRTSEDQPSVKPGSAPTQEDANHPTGGAGQSRRADSPVPTKTDQTAEWESEGGSPPDDISAVDADGVPDTDGPVVEDPENNKLPVPPYGGD